MIQWNVSQWMGHKTSEIPQAVVYGHLKQEFQAKSQCFMGSRNRKIRYELFQLVNELKQ